MAVPMKRSTNTAPVSWSISYLMGSALAGISMMTLKTSGALAPAGTLSRLMMDGDQERLEFLRTRKCRTSRASLPAEAAFLHVADIFAALHKNTCMSAKAGYTGVMLQRNNFMLSLQRCVFLCTFQEIPT